MLALLSRAFRKRRKLAEEFKNHELDQLLMAKWLDPIGASLATYECVRRNQRKFLKKVASNMTDFFGDLPDTAAIARIAGDKNAPTRVCRSSSTACALSPTTQWLPSGGASRLQRPLDGRRGAVQVPTSGLGPRPIRNPSLPSARRVK